MADSGRTHIFQLIAQGRQPPCIIRASADNIISSEETVKNGLLAISSGTKYLELASDEVDHRLEVVRRAVSTGLGLGGLHQAIDAFKDAVGDVGVVPAQDAVPVPLDGPGGIDHGLKAA